MGFPSQVSPWSPTLCRVRCGGLIVIAASSCSRQLGGVSGGDFGPDTLSQAFRLQDVYISLVPMSDPSDWTPVILWYQCGII